MRGIAVYFVPNTDPFSTTACERCGCTPRTICSDQATQQKLCPSCYAESLAEERTLYPASPTAPFPKRTKQLIANNSYLKFLNS